MLFSKRVVLIIFIFALLVPAVVASDDDFFLSFAAKPMTFDQLYNQAGKVLNRPVLVTGIITSQILNSTRWLEVPPLVLLGPNYTSFIGALLGLHPFAIFLNEYTSGLGGPPRRVQDARAAIGIVSERFLPIVFDRHPNVTNVVVEYVQVLSFVRSLSVNGFSFYYIEFHSWSTLILNA